MLAITLPVMVIGLLPIIVIETYLLSKKHHINFKDTIKSIALANGVSTILGTPLTWGALLLIQMLTGGGKAYGLQTPLDKFLAVTWQAPWLIPYNEAWVWPAATLFLLVPFFIMSWLVETAIVWRMLENFPFKKIKKSMLLANSTTYGIFALLALAKLVQASI